MTRAPALAALAALLAPALAGCLAPAVDAPAPAATDAASRPLASYLHDVSEKDPSVTVLGSVLQQFKIPTADGVRLDAWVARPPVDEPVPLVLWVTPYFGGGSPLTGHCPSVLLVSRRDGGLGEGHCFYAWGDELVPRGYAVGVVSVRGTGASEGCFTLGGPSEARDTAAAIEFLAAEPWSNSRVGLMGVSYPGTTAQDAWVEAPSALKTIVPISGISDLYKYNFANGVPLAPQGFAFNAYYWGMVGLSPAGLEGGHAALDPTSLPGSLAGEACPEQLEVQRAGLDSARTGDKSAFWQERDFLAELAASPERERASVFYVHGLQDWNVKPHHMEDWLAAVQATGVPFKAWLGQWDHAWPDANGRCTVEGQRCRADWIETMVAWFDQFLKERDTGILDAPAVQIQADDRAWRHADAFPPADVTWRALHPTPDGGLAEGAGSGEARFHDRAGLHPASLPRCEDPTGRGAQRANDPGVVALAGPDRAAFVSDALAVDTRIVGLPRFEADVTAAGARASLVLTLYERAANGDRPLGYAAQSLNHVASLEAGDPDVAGERQRVDVDFFPLDVVVAAGSRLVLVATGFDLEGVACLQPVSSGGEIAIDLATARLELPLGTVDAAETPTPYPDASDAGGVPA